MQSVLFPPSLPFKPPPGRSWGTTKSAGEGIRRTRARVRACAAGRMYAQLHHCAASARQGRGFAAGPRGPFCRSVGKCRVRRCEAAGSGSAERRARCRSAGWPFGTLRLLGVGAGAHPESLARWPRRLIRGVETIGVENRSEEIFVDEIPVRKPPLPSSGLFWPFRCRPHSVPHHHWRTRRVRWWWVVCSEA